MSIESVPGTDLRYYLISFDANGRERTDDPGGIMSQQSVEAVRSDNISDVFLLSHGWKGDVAAAKEQYTSWLTAAAQCKDDLARLQARPGGFRPLVIGLHWPSQPWGDEEFASAAASFGPGTMPSDEQLIERYADRLADTVAARQALRTILAASRVEVPPDRLPSEVRDAYRVLDREAGLGNKGLGAAPGADREPFDPDLVYEDARDGPAQSFGLWSSVRDTVLSPLRQLSFWKMKDRACQVGETGVHELLKALLAALPEVRLHLMGHSFGCIVASAAVVGPPGGAGLPRPVQSMMLVQGALSLWSCCAEIPYRPGTPGYFHLLAEGRVAGPVVTTRSRFDTAVGRWYPLGARLARQVAFAPAQYPMYGGVGTFGLRGPGLDNAFDGPLLETEGVYDFQPGRVYNLECSSVIREGGGASGAHCDIAHPEVAHAAWSAALAAGASAAGASATLSFTAKGGPADGPSPTLADLIRTAGRVAADLGTRVRVEIEINPPRS
jgi:hypothetical protein